MSILPIRIFPDPILRQRAHPINKINASISQLARDMHETLENAKGIGLAANQVGILKRLAVLNVPGDIPRTLINPKITASRGEHEVLEGCLSLPGYVGLVTRAVQVSAHYLDINGGRIKLTAEELLAQAIQHEIDHLNGILYLDHLAAHEKLAKEGVSADEPHWHDVGYEVYVSKEKHNPSDNELVELVKATAELSKLNSDSDINDVNYDLGKAHTVKGYEIPKGVSKLRGLHDDT